MTLLGVICGLVWAFIQCEFTQIAYGTIIFMIIGVVAGIGFAKNQMPAEYETQYKVTISDEVSMNDFLARYEIIDQEGKIYTVREIEDGK